MTTSGFVALLGRAQTNPQLRSFLADLGPPLTDRDADREYYTFPGSGVELTFEDGVGLGSIFLRSGREPGEEPMACYEGDLPHGLFFGASRSDVQTLLGVPAASGGACVDLGMQVLAWDKFDFGSYSLHVRYSLDEGGLNQVIISLPY